MAQVSLGKQQTKRISLLRVQRSAGGFVGACNSQCKTYAVVIIAVDFSHLFDRVNFLNKLQVFERMRPSVFSTFGPAVQVWVEFCDSTTHMYEQHIRGLRTCGLNDLSLDECAAKIPDPACARTSNQTRHV